MTEKNSNKSAIATFTKLLELSDTEFKAYFDKLTDSDIAPLLEGSGMFQHYSEFALERIEAPAMTVMDTNSISMVSYRLEGLSSASIVTQFLTSGAGTVASQVWTQNSNTFASQLLNASGSSMIVNQFLSSNSSTFATQFLASSSSTTSKHYLAANSKTPITTSYIYAEVSVNHLTVSKEEEALYGTTDDQVKAA